MEGLPVQLRPPASLRSFEAGLETVLFKMAADAAIRAFLDLICRTNKSIPKSLDDLGEGEAQIWLRPENPSGVRSGRRARLKRSGARRAGVDEAVQPSSGNFENKINPRLFR